MKLHSIIDKAFYRLKGFCEKQIDCTNYRFNNYGECAMEMIPADWEMPVKEKDGDGDV